MVKRPLFSVAIAFAAGVALSGMLGLPLSVALIGLAFGCCASIAMKRPAAAILFVVAALGLLRYEAFTTVVPDDVSSFSRSSVTAVHGQIRTDVDIRHDRAMIPLSVTAVESYGRTLPARGKLMLTYYRPFGVPSWEPPAYGDVLLVNCRVSRPSASAGVSGFSWRDYLARQGIHAVAYVRDPEDIAVVRHAPSNPLMSLALRARQGLATSIYAAMPHEEASVVVGMDLGTYTSLPSRLLTNFAKTGTLHLLAASGFNCAVIVAVFGFLLAKLLKLPRKLTNPALICLLIFYMMMVGAKPSIVRATVMAVLLLAGSFINRPSDGLNLLFTAAVVILAIKPSDLFDVGFQLSFAAVLALIVVLPVIEKTAERWANDRAARKQGRGWLHKLTRGFTRDAWQGLTATAAATLGTLPLSAHYFNQLSLVSIPVNVIVASAVLPIFAIGLLMPVLSHIPGIGWALAGAGTLVTRASLSSINWFGELPNSCLYVPSPGAAGIIGYYLLLAVGIKYANSRVREKPGKSGS